VNDDQKKLLEDYLQKFHDTYREMLSNEHWQDSPMLKLLHEKLSKVIDEFDDLIGIAHSVKADHETEDSFDRAAHFKSQDMQLIFIYLYTSEGKMLDAWERVLSNISKQYISRPIYASEEDAQGAAQFSPILINAGYVAVWVKKSALIEEDDAHQIKDKLGKRLISLKDRSVNLENMEYFWNNYMLYDWKDGKLVFKRLVEKFLK
jgi:intracellular multiplication protein IcmQ